MATWSVCHCFWSKHAGGLATNSRKVETEVSSTLWLRVWVSFCNSFWPCLDLVTVCFSHGFMGWPYASCNELNMWLIIILSCESYHMFSLSPPPQFQSYLTQIFFLSYIIPSMLPNGFLLQPFLSFQAMHCAFIGGVGFLCAYLCPQWISETQLCPRNVFES